MRNKNVGFLILGLAAVIAVIILIFNKALRDIVGATCTHGSSCSMYSTLNVQTWISLSVVGLLVIIGLFLILSKEEKEIVIKKVKVEVNKKKNIDYSKLDKEEKTIVKLLEEEKGSMFQAGLVEKSGFSKVKITRLLDRLEGKQIIERKRRGMTNIVILK